MVGGSSPSPAKTAVSTMLAAAPSFIARAKRIIPFFFPFYHTFSNTAIKNQLKSRKDI